MGNKFFKDIFVLVNMILIFAFFFNICKIGFSEDSAIVMGVASPAFIFKTVDGGKSWNLGKTM